MDGRNDSPTVYNNYRTHNHATVTQNFLLKNGILNQLYYSPDDADWGGSWYDLVMSFQSWCFHYEPGIYLSQVLKCTQNGSIVVVDVRKGKPETVMVYQGAKVSYDGKAALALDKPATVQKAVQ